MAILNLKAWLIRVLAIGLSATVTTSLAAAPRDKAETAPQAQQATPQTREKPAQLGTPEALPSSAPSATNAASVPVSAPNGTGASQPTASMLAGCTKDSECKGDRICEKGQCVDPDPKLAQPIAGVGATGNAAKLPRIPVRIISEMGRLQLSLEGEGKELQSCATPCSTSVPRGKLNLLNAPNTKQSIVNIDTPSTITLTGSSTGKLVAGIVLVVVGAGLFVPVFSGNIGLLPAVGLGAAGGACLGGGGALIANSSGGITVSSWK
jgi:hypothetical protein